MTTKLPVPLALLNDLAAGKIQVGRNGQASSKVLAQYRKKALIGTAVRVENSAHGVPCYAVTLGNATVHLTVVSDTEWSGNFAKEFGDRCAREAWRLGFPSRFLVAAT